MNNLLTKQNLIYLGVGLASAYLFYNLIVNREKAKGISIQPKNKLNEKKSDFCGCGA
jgi:hypothetical protein